MGNSDDYYRQRIEEELAAAERSADPSIALIHREMARRYHDMIEARPKIVTHSEAEASGLGFNGA